MKKLFSVTYVSNLGAKRTVLCKETDEQGIYEAIGGQRFLISGKSIALLGSRRECYLRRVKGRETLAEWRKGRYVSFDHPISIGAVHSITCADDVKVA